MFYSKPWLDALIVILVLLLFFGPKRLPALGKSLGEGMREFKDGISSRSKDPDSEERPAIEAATGQTALQSQAQAQPQQAPPATVPPQPVQPPAVPAQQAPPATVPAQPQRSEPEAGSTSGS